MAPYRLGHKKCQYISPLTNNFLGDLAVCDDYLRFFNTTIKGGLVTMTTQNIFRMQCCTCQSSALGAYLFVANLNDTTSGWDSTVVGGGGTEGGIIELQSTPLYNLHGVKQNQMNASFIQL